MHLEKLKTSDNFNENFVISVLKNYIVTVDDLTKIEKITKLNLNGQCSSKYKKLIKNINLVYEVFKYSENVEGEINLLGLIYKFENIFQADITSLIINILNRYYTNIHFYLPISKTTFITVRNDFIRMINLIPKSKQRLIIGNSTSGIKITKEHFIVNDRVVGKVMVPIIVQNRRLGQLMFYYIDYKMKAKAKGIGS